MRTSFWKHCGMTLALSGLSGAVLTTGTWAAAQEAKPAERKQIEVEIQVEGANPAKPNFYRVIRQAEVKDAATKGGEYWIGLQLATLDELARTQFKLKQGVAAEGVLPDSPAAAAGMQKFDVLLKFGDTAIETPEDLMAAVEKSKGKTVEFKVLRGGQETTLKITPAKRPQEGGGKFEIELKPGGDEVRRLEAWIKGLQKGEPGADPLQMHILRPGVMLADRLKAVEFPKDLSISINKHGNDPAKILVKKGEKSWQTTSDKLGELPEDLRIYVEQLMGGSFAQLGPHALRLRVDGPAPDTVRTKVLPIPPIPAVPPVPPVPAVPGVRVVPRVEVREFHAEKQNLEGVQKQLQELLKKVEDLRAQAQAREDSSLEKMKSAVDQLRKELEELRKNSSKAEKKRDD